VPKLAGVDTLALFRNLKDDLWSKQTLEFASRISESMSFSNIGGAIHCRYGDILEGDFRQYPDVKKYVPFVAISKFIEKNSQQSWVVISDTPQVVEVLKSKSHTVVDRSTILMENQFNSIPVDLFDLLLLQESKQVVGPSESAFSKLGAHLSGKEPLELVNELGPTEWEQIFGDILELEIYKDFDPRLRGLIQSRDIAWVLDFRMSYLGLGKFSEAAKIACAVDAENVVAQCQLAFSLGCGNDFVQSLEILNQAKEYASEVKNIHRDPLFYVFSMLFIVQVLQIFRLGFKQRNLQKIKNLFGELESAISMLNDLDPYQLPKDEIIGNFRDVMESIRGKVNLRSTQKRIPLHVTSILFPPKNSTSSDFLNFFIQRIFSQNDYEHMLVVISTTLNTLSSQPLL
jgi:hypothetical protein